jgi:hypothetical protein
VLSFYCFEKLILKKNLEVQEENNCDQTNVNHGLKQKHSTSTLRAKMQSLIARALDESEFAIIGSLNLSSAFDIANVNLLLKIMKIMCLPCNVLRLIKVWLKDRSFFGSIYVVNFTFYNLLLGTVQGLILGPVL